MYKLTEHVRSQTDHIYSWLQENIAIGKVTIDMLPYLNDRVRAHCDTLYENEWYKDGRQVMITPTHETKDKFNASLLQHLDGDIGQFPAKDTPSKRTPNLPNLSILNEQQTKGLPTDLSLKKNCPVKITKKQQQIRLTCQWNLRMGL